MKTKEEVSNIGEIFIVIFLYSPYGKSKVLNWSVEPNCCGNRNRDHKYL